MTPRVQRQVLHALFRLSRDTRHISAATLAAALGLTPTRAAEALLALERAGLVDATRARLTMRGLAIAMAGGAGRGGLSRDDALRAVPAAPAPRSAQPWAAADESRARPVSAALASPSSMAWRVTQP